MDQLNKNAQISATIVALVNAGASVAEAFDMVFGKGTYVVFVSNLYNELREKAKAAQNK